MKYEINSDFLESNQIFSKELLICLLLFILNVCQAQNKDIVMTEKDTSLNAIFERNYDPKTGLEMYNFELMKSSSIYPTAFKTTNGWIILVHPMMIGGGTYSEYSPPPEFIMVQKSFYPNGMLKQKSSFFQNDLKMGIWEYYDEEGNLIKKVDENEKFKLSKIKFQDILNILEKEGWVDLKTGKGATEIIRSENHVQIIPGFNVFFTIGVNNKVTWYATKSLFDGALVISYKIDGDSGHVTREEIPIYNIE